MHILESSRTSLLEDLETWIRVNHLDVNVLSEDVYEVKNIGKFLLINPKSLTPTEEDKNEIVLQEFKLYLDEFEYSLISEVDYFLFQFGTQFYYCKDIDDPQLDLFKYLGKAKLELQEDYPYLGIHGGYELCHGSRLYKDWCKKAKFIGLTTLGICEDNTLSGVISFQNTCEKEKIKSIIGETVTVRENEDRYRVKLFPINQKGFENLTQINNKLNSHYEKYIEYTDLSNWSSDLICVLSTEVELTPLKLHNYTRLFKNLYYQIDYREWSSNERDLKHLENLKIYLSEYHDKLKPILLTDSYYLDKEDSVVRKYLNKIGNVGFKPQSDTQYFKTVDDIYTESCLLFKEDDIRQLSIIQEGIESCKELVSKIDFKLQATGFFMPEYEMNSKESEKFNSNEDLFFSLIETGFNNKVKGKVEDEEIYWNRLEKEIEVLQKGNFIDYFLILWDVYQFCESEGIWVGLGRGSAAGSAVSWLLGITGLDPIKYNLLFERFLNEARLFKNLKTTHVVVNSGQDSEIEFDFDKFLYIFRDGKNQYIQASNLKDGDRILNL